MIAQFRLDSSLIFTAISSIATINPARGSSSALGTFTGAFVHRILVIGISRGEYIRNPHHLGAHGHRPDRRIMCIILQQSG